ncbi:MAG: hypothetical protein HYU55_06070 [Nocardioides sp.]|nr:hypothetical protein [Nocardioides sp.]
MEFIELNSPARVSGEHVLVISHSSTALTRGLNHGEAVVLQTQDGERYAAEVIDIGFWPEDTVYTFALGARLPEDVARERIAGLDPEKHDLALHEIIDLLGELARPQDEDPA